MKFADRWTRTADHWCRKRPLYLLRHKHYTRCNRCFLNMGQSRPLYVYFCPFLITIQIYHNWKRRRSCAWELNLGLQDGSADKTNTRVNETLTSIKEGNPNPRPQYIEANSLTSAPTSSSWPSFITTLFAMEGGMWGENFALTSWSQLSRSSLTLSTLSSDVQINCKLCQYDRACESSK